MSAAQARQFVRMAMTALVGEGHVALACAPRIVFTEADVDAWAEQREAEQEGRHADPFGRGRINFHD